MNAGRRFHSGYRETICLADRRPLHIRLIRPTDKPKLAAAFHQLSVESRYNGLVNILLPVHAGAG